MMTMKLRVDIFMSLSLLFLHLLLLLHLNPTRVSAKTLSNEESEHASFPPRGWNSYDSFSWIISEEEFLQNAQIISERLHAYGYEYVVVDFLWFRRKVKGAYTDSKGFDVIDKWGRMVPDPDRWPSSAGGKGFTEVANKVHSMGLKFGIHVMRGISTQAVNANTPILDTTTGGAYEESGRKWSAKDIGVKERACAWMSHGFMSVDTKLGAGRAFLRSLYEQYAEWGVDFVKHDCVFGADLDINEISVVSEVLKQLDRPILYSLSPGTSVTPAMAKDVSGLANMYRITADDWDSWGDVASHFDVTRDEKMSYKHQFQGNLQLFATEQMDFCLGASPTLKLTSKEFERGAFLPCRWDTNQMWVLNSNGTLANSYSGLCATVNSVEAEVSSGGTRSWVATGRRGEIYVAFFNLNPVKTVISAMISDLAHVVPGKNFSGTSCNCKEVWSGKDFGVIKQSISMTVEVHGCALFVLNCY